MACKPTWRSMAEELGRPSPGAPVSRQDLPAIADPLRAYQAWRAARGLPPSDFWREKVRKALEAQGIVKAKPLRSAPESDSVGSAPLSGPSEVTSNDE